MAPLVKMGDGFLEGVEVDLAEEHKDLSLLLANWNGVTRYNIYYCEDHEKDRESALSMADCPGVTLHPRPGNIHGVVHVMNEMGELPDLLPPFEGIEDS